ncbi:hypothetical protein NE237_023458 [Protea cynaroides]|uniref:Uncharacterized protein n=1 Tax=Protea cynaroides TaxID=273540 RepID=A0A9Q0HH55_9MAGN|nr:hypothetical protein NE237_023458 [Protea cynaroides]
MVQSAITFIQSARLNVEYLISLWFQSFQKKRNRASCVSSSPTGCDFSPILVLFRFLRHSDHGVHRHSNRAIYRIKFRWQDFPIDSDNGLTSLILFEIFFPSSAISFNNLR